MKSLRIPLAVAALLLTTAGASAQRIGVTVTTVANLPSTCEPQGIAYVVTDGNSNTDCSTGSGSTQHWCFCNAAGTGYDAQPNWSPTDIDTDYGAESVSSNWTVTGDWDFSAGGLEIEQNTTLPACTDGQIAMDTDAPSGQRLYACEAGVYVLQGDGGGAPGVDSIGTSELDDSADTPLAGEWVQVSGDTTDFVYRTDAELLTDTGAAPLSSPALTGDPTGPTATQGDSDTSLATTAFVGGEIRGWWHFPAFDLQVDGTKCKSPSGKQIAGGPWVYSIDCDDDAGSIIYGYVHLSEYEGGTLSFELEAINVNATPSGILDFDFSAMCRGNDDAINSTWGTAVNASITFATQNDIMVSATAAVTPDGTCAASDVLFFRAVMDSAATTTQVADVEIIGVALVEL